MAIVTCTVYVTVCEIITYELLKFRIFESLTFIEKVKAMSCNVTDSNVTDRIKILFYYNTICECD